jgi:spermidine synthase
MKIDGAAGTTLGEFSSPEDIAHLRFDVTNVAYYLRPQGGACIIGVGAGRDIQSALLFGHEKIIGIDVNPIFIQLLQGEFREFAGIADRAEVTLVVDEARSFLSRTKEQYGIIQMSLIDTWAATGAGAFSLSENALYTSEAWQIFLDRLADKGIFTVSRWYNPDNLGETGRVVSLAVTAFLESGIPEPSGHIAMLTTASVSTLLLSKQPFTQQDITTLRQVASDLQYDLAILPGKPPIHKALRDIVSARSPEELERAIANEFLNYTPPTDENPYFFNMLRLKYIIPVFFSKLGEAAGVIRGNLHATLTLSGLIVCLVLLTMVLIVFPLLVRGRLTSAYNTPLRLPTPGPSQADSGLTGKPTPDPSREGNVEVSDQSLGIGNSQTILPRPGQKILWAGAFYFSLIGAGFMLVEIALIQRLSVFLGHPIYALGILLFTIIASTGIGSLLSERLPLTRYPWIFIYPLVTACAILMIRFLLTILLTNMIASPMLSKLLASVLVIFPMGVLLGFFFPTGMRLVTSIIAAETPWYWALNGIFSVLCSALAVFISIYFGISTNFYIAAGCYLLLLFFLYNIYEKIKIQTRT